MSIGVHSWLTLGCGAAALGNPWSDYLGARESTILISPQEATVQGTATLIAQYHEDKIIAALRGNRFNRCLRCSGNEMNVRLKLGLGRVAFVVGLGPAVARLIFISNASAQEPTPSPFQGGSRASDRYRIKHPDCAGGILVAGHKIHGRMAAKVGC